MRESQVVTNVTMESTNQQEREQIRSEDCIDVNELMKSFGNHSFCYILLSFIGWHFYVRGNYLMLKTNLSLVQTNFALIN